MQQNKTDERALLKELLLTTDKLGTDKTIELLSAARNENLSMQDEKITFIFHMVLKEFKLSFEQLIAKKSGGHKKKQALIVTCYFLQHPKMGYSLRHIGNLIERSQTMVAQYCKMMEKAEKNSTILNYKKVFTPMVNTFIKKINNKK